MREGKGFFSITLLTTLALGAVILILGLFIFRDHSLFKQGTAQNKKLKNIPVKSSPSGLADSQWITATGSKCNITYSLPPHTQPFIKFTPGHEGDPKYERRWYVLHDDNWYYGNLQLWYGLNIYPSESELSWLSIDCIQNKGLNNLSLMDIYNLHFKGQVSIINHQYIKKWGFDVLELTLKTDPSFHLWLLKNYIFKDNTFVYMAAEQFKTDDGFIMSTTNQILDSLKFND